MTNEQVNLFTPLKLKHTTLRNRSIMGSMHTGLEESKNGFSRLANFYVERAKGGVGLIVTGGIAPNLQGRLSPFNLQLSFPWQVSKHKKMTSKVQAAGAKICMQILHAGRYSYHPLAVSSSKTKSPISKFGARKITKLEIKKTIFDFANCSALAKKAGYDGVEIMGSEGYFLNQFLAPATNHRDDQYGGSFENRSRIVGEILTAVRKKVGRDFIIIYRLSMLDLIKNGMSFDEVITLAKKLEGYGVDIINSGIGWHEARVPTIATMVPRAAFAWITERVKKEVNLPVIATNRINNAQTANEILQKNQADLISMARPYLADPEIINKMQAGEDDDINTCIGCNQACLDHVFSNKMTSCLVNPKACHEDQFTDELTNKAKNLCVIGSGPAGLSFAIEAAIRGHKVTVLEKSDKMGGQFNLAKEIPGKEEFHETIRYFSAMIKKHNIDLKLNSEATLESLQNSDYDEFIFSTGIKPRIPNIPGINHPKCISYQELIRKRPEIGKKVAVLGAGGIGFDIAELLTLGSGEKSTSLDLEAFLKEWGVDTNYAHRGAIIEKEAHPSARKIYLLQRKKTKHGKGLGRTTGWIHRHSLKDKKVEMLAGVQYNKIDDQGLHITHNEEEKILDVDHVIICAGQVSVNELYNSLQDESNKPCHIIGGAELALEIDAKRAIDQGVRLANKI